MTRIKVLIFLGLQLFATQAWAQESIAASEKSIPGGTLALISYIVLWFMLLGYFVVLTTRLHKIKSDTQVLEKRIDDLFNELG